MLACYADCERGYVDEVLPAKLALSLDYLARRTLRSDLGILAHTLVRIARGGRAHPDTTIAAPADRRTRRAALG